MKFYVGEKEAERRVCVSLNETEGEVEVLLNGTAHLCLSRDGDVVMYTIFDSGKVPGVQYTNGKLKIWEV